MFSIGLIVLVDLLERSNQWFLVNIMFFLLIFATLKNYNSKQSKRKTQLIERRPLMVCIFFLLTIHSVNYRLVYETVRCASHCGAIALINERRYANLLEEENY